MQYNYFKGSKHEAKKLKKDTITLERTIVNSLITDFKKIEEVPKSNLIEDVHNYVAESHSNVLNKYTITGNDKINNVLEEMDFNYFWNVGKKLCSRNGEVAFFVYNSLSNNRPAIKIITPDARNYRASVLKDVRFIFTQLNNAYDNETAEIILRTNADKTISKQVIEHNYNDALVNKKINLKSQKEIVLPKNLKQLPVFIFSNNAEWKPTISPEVDNLIGEWVNIKDQQFKEGLLAKTKLFLVDDMNDPAVIKNRAKEFLYDDVQSINALNKDVRDYTDYSPNQVDKIIQSKRDFWDNISKFCYLEREATSKGAQQTDNEISQTNSQVLNYFENKIQIWNKTFNDMINCIAQLANLGKVKAEIKLSTRMESQLNPPSTMGVNMNRSEDD